MSGCEGSEPYALRVLGDSMEPEFIDGEVIIIEPGNVGENGSYVIARYNDEFFFRQLQFDNEQWYLKPLNDRYPKLQISNGADIKGKIISKSSGRGRQTKSYL